jgi:5-methyltetrahydropteroyltriglutamate--homocysteine methyltransferase
MRISTEPIGSIPRLGRLGTCDACAFSPFGDDVSTPRDAAFAKVRAPVEGTRLASERAGV